MKKLLSILSILWISSLSNLTIISCKKYLPQFSMQEQENDVIEAINQKNINHDNNVTANDLLPNPQISCNPQNNQWNFNYDIKINQTANTFLNQDFCYLVPEVIGSFSLNLQNSIENNKINFLKNINNDYNSVLSYQDLLVGNTNDFIAIFNVDDWNDVVDRILDNADTLKYLNETLNLKNHNINLTNNDWSNLLNQLGAKYHTSGPNNGYSFLMHVVNKQLVFANLNADGSTSMLYADNWAHVLNSLYKIDENKYQFLLSKDILFQLNDMHNYQEKLWNDASIKSLIINKLWLTNCNIDDAINNLKNLFSNSNNIAVINMILNDNIHRDFAINVINNNASLDYLS